MASSLYPRLNRSGSYYFTLRRKTLRRVIFRLHAQLGSLFAVGYGKGGGRGVEQTSRKGIKQTSRTKDIGRGENKNSLRQQAKKDNICEHFFSILSLLRSAFWWGGLAPMCRVRHSSSGTPTSQNRPSHRPPSSFR